MPTRKRRPARTDPPDAPEGPPADSIVVEGARQNNLKGLNLRIPLNALTVVTGVSGSGKSSLAFDTVYAEGQRRYVETFSPYTRQFLDRMDKPRVDRIDGIPPAIAIDQTNPVRTSRSTVGTMTELADHLKLLYARAARLFCGKCGREVRRDGPESIVADLLARAASHAAFGAPATALITFPVTVPPNFAPAEIESLLAQQGYRRILAREDGRWEVIQDRLELTAANRGRIVEDLEAAMKYGQGRVSARPLDPAGTPGEPWRYSADLHCPDCDIHYRDPVPNLFSFNSPIGACPQCRGFGRTIGVDYDLVIPDPSKTLAEGAVKPWQTPSFSECQDELVRFARRRGVPVDVPWGKLGKAHRSWVLEGEGDGDGVWYGVRGFFGYLESKSYKMHIRVLLSRYRAYRPCPECGGARLKPEALMWKLGGLSVHEAALLPIDGCLAFFRGLELPAPLDEATDLLLREIRTRLGYLVDVGLGYLTLDRQSRTLSGGEVQRINLTTALGTSLVNTLFVLDEPSIGLHSRDIRRLIGVLRRLRDAGNTLLVVEHDPELIRAADYVLDMGPGAGAKGGEAVFFGTGRELLASGESLTARYLTGALRVGAVAAPGTVAPASSLEVLGAREHNLKGIDVSIPLGRLVCVTGVSGSGKSTLVQDILYPGLRRLLHQGGEEPGAHGEIRGHEGLAAAVLVDQSPIGRTARSNPASYVGAFDPIRALFAAEPLARERGYRTGTFSFNAGSGRCPTCGGTGFEHVEMQFLSDVYLRCPDCDGSRYRPEVLEVKLLPPSGSRFKALSVADVLALTVAEAIEFFAGSPEVLRGLDPLVAVGLEYLALGQPVPTLSGGEAQRLKLAGHLAEGRGDARARGAGGTLFLFDEPTTGLHFQDIDRLLSAFRGLLAAGDSVLVIEHNLDVIRAADWVIDLGPEGGEEGGRLVCAGTVERVMRCPESHTGRALLDYRKAIREAGRAGGRAGRGTAAAGTAAPADIRIHGAREHNLQNLDVTVPRDAFTVITGVSGSGKSTVAFDILFAEGQRRYLESLNAYARQFAQPAARPDVDGVFGLPPTVAIEQRTSRGGRKSTVATLTEVYHFLRLLYVKLGVQHCPDCGVPIEPQTRESIAARILRDWRGRTVTLLAPLVDARKGFYNDLAAWAASRGFAELRVDGAMVPTVPWPRLDRFKEHTIEAPAGRLRIAAEGEGALREALDRALDVGKGVVRVAAEAARREAVFSVRRACPRCGRSFEDLDPRLFSFNSKHGWCPSCYGTGLRLSGFDGEQTGEEHWWNEWWGGPEEPCPACGGRRLRPEALAVRFRGESIADLTALSIGRARERFRALRLAGRDAEIARDILAEIRPRLEFLDRVGLSYLSLDRSAPTLSGGEAQRIRLAAQLGSNLRGVCYVLDEPTIGLHARDNLVLLETLKQLRRKGNTVVVVEHDEETIRRAEHVIDLGPGGGKGGGRLVAQGTVRDLMRNPASMTGRFLKAPLRHPLRDGPPRPLDGPSVRVLGASLHNLRDVEASFPLGALTCVTGVSGSGKSTLVREVLHANLAALLSRAGRRGRQPKPAGCGGIEGWQGIGRVLEVDQTPIGNTPRSCPATYVGIWDEVRRLFAAVPEAKMRGYTPSRFSFNVAGGRCAECEGQGLKRIEMSFLPDVTVACEACGGTRFTEETRAVKFHGKDAAQVLAMSVDEAVEFFSFHQGIRHALALLQDVGLGYLSLGQQSPSLSGGEAQRIKLVTELAKARAGRTLYVLDEPTIGLHMADVERLVRVFHRLVDAGNTVVVIEHNLDVIAEADWILDMGPEGGAGGGRIVAQGRPMDVASVRNGSHTSGFLREFLASRGRSRRA